MPKGKPNIQLTPALIASIAQNISLGAFPAVAAEAAGVPQELFARWCQTIKGRGRHSALCRLLLREVRQASAKARLLAEATVLNQDPKAWLLQGPGRRSGDSDGWTQPAKAPKYDNRSVTIQGVDQMGLIAEILKLLAPFPEARLALARAFGDHSTESIQSAPTSQNDELLQITDVQEVKEETVVNKEMPTEQTNPPQNPPQPEMQNR